MNTFSREILEIRKRIPIGIQEALQLLEKHAGKIELAEKDFIADRISILQSKHTLPEEVALAYLSKYNFDIPNCLKKIEEDQYTFTELILRSKKKSADKISLICTRIVEEAGLSKENWISLESLQKLPEASFKLMLISSFLDYCEWEGFSSALMGEKTEAVISLLAKEFPTSALSEIIQEARQIALDLYAEAEKKEGNKFSITTSFYKTLSEHERFRQLDNNFEAELDSLYELLEAFVAKDKAAFPS